MNQKWESKYFDNTMQVRIQARQLRQKAKCNLFSCTDCYKEYIRIQLKMFKINLFEEEIFHPQPNILLFSLSKSSHIYLSCARVYLGVAECLDIYDCFTRNIITETDPEFQSKPSPNLYFPFTRVIQSELVYEVGAQLARM